MCVFWLFFSKIKQLSDYHCAKDGTGIAHGEAVWTRLGRLWLCMRDRYYPLREPLLMYHIPLSVEKTVCLSMLPRSYNLIPFEKTLLHLGIVYFTLGCIMCKAYQDVILSYTLNVHHILSPERSLLREP